MHTVTAVLLAVVLAGGATAVGLMAHDRTPMTGRSVATMENEQNVARRKAWIARTLNKYFNEVETHEGLKDR